MRVLDRPRPALSLDEDVETIASWPVRPVIAIESIEAFRHWDDPAQLWDEDAIWDDRWADATCAWTGLEIEHGALDDQGLFPASRCVLQLDNRDGRWSSLNADGSPSLYAPGQGFDVWGRDQFGTPRGFGDLNFGDETFGGDTFEWWLFSGKIARWDQRADDTIEVEAFDTFSDLAMPIGTFTPGSVGQRPGDRLEAILTAAGLAAAPHRFEIGNVTLTRQPTDAAPLEEMQIVSQSDGGLLFVDSDGTLISRDRNWRVGRSDQPAVPVLSDNVCSAQAVIWDAVLAVTDTFLADRVVLQNLAELTATAGVSGGYVISLTDQQWTTQIEGDILAQLYLDTLQPRRVQLDEFSLYLLDPHQPELWRLIDLRRLDAVGFVHDQKVFGGGALSVQVTMLVTSLTHTITPEGGWTMTVSTGRAQTYVLPILYDDGHLYDDGELYGY